MKRAIIYIFLFFVLMPIISAQTLQDAKTLTINKQYEQAVSVYRTIQKKSVNFDADASKFFGQALCMSGLYKESIPYLEKGAKGNKTGAWWYLGISKQHLYDFTGAIDALETYKSLCSKESVWIPRTDSIIAECQIGQKGVNRVQDVVIIDSMIVNRQYFFEYYRLGAESGKVRNEGMFETQAGDYRLWAEMDEEKEYHLYEQHKFGNEWGDPEIVESIENEGFALCYPFLRSDSETLFFASNRTPGFGGYDIYKTHYNADSESYFAPERMGMPFNSPFDDYLMAIDETHMVGWWATNRNVADSLVCIYLFKFDEEPRYLTGLNPDRARVSSIRDTWSDDTDYAAFAKDVLSAPQRIVKHEKVFIPICDDIVYSDAEDFKVAEARQSYERWLSLNESLVRAEKSLDQLREEWHVAKSGQRTALVKKIDTAEKQCLSLQRQILEARKRYCRLELQYLNK